MFSTSNQLDITSVGHTATSCIRLCFASGRPSRLDQASPHATRRLEEHPCRCVCISCCTKSHCSARVSMALACDKGVVDDAFPFPSTRRRSWRSHAKSLSILDNNSSSLQTGLAKTGCLIRWQSLIWIIAAPAYTVRRPFPVARFRSRRNLKNLWFPLCMPRFSVRRSSFQKTSVSSLLTRG